ncbi:TIGR00730 family Rossman fold protein [Candidatus Neomarinimicrobiota bacterium]
MHRVCVFCGSSPGARPEYRQAAERLGQILVERKLGLVYGGARVGLMGKLAETVFHAGGEVIGVIPAALVEKEVAFKELHDLRVVDTMHERKALMAELADGFLALPGGLGTLEEFLEVLTWGQLGMHAKPCGILNVNGYFDHLLAFMDRAVTDTFVREEHRSMLLVHEDPAQLLNLFDTYQPPTLDKAHWILSINNL